MFVAAIEDVVRTDSILPEPDPDVHRSAVALESVMSPRVIWPRDEAVAFFRRAAIVREEIERNSAKPKAPPPVLVEDKVLCLSL